MNGSSLDCVGGALPLGKVTLATEQPERLRKLLREIDRLRADKALREIDRLRAALVRISVSGSLTHARQEAKEALSK